MPNHRNKKNSKSNLKRKWRIRRHQSLGSLMLGLNHVKRQFHKKTTHLQLAKAKLDESKKELKDMIAEVRKLEEKIHSEKDRCQDSIEQFEEEVNEASLFYWDSPNHSKMQTVQTWTGSNIRSTLNKIREAELELNSQSSIVSKDDNSEEQSRTSLIAPITIRLPNIDTLGTLTESDSFKTDYSRKCCLCLERGIDCVFYECAHECCCTTCANDVKKKNAKCPVCGSSIRKIIKIYYS